MGAVRRVEFDRALLHVYTRGNNRARVFFDEYDYVGWLRLLARTVKKFGWACHSYCLMPNHFHLLLEASRHQISAGMRHLNGSFAQRINTRYDRTGHVFEGPYHEELITDQAHLLEVCRYIPLNPVRAGLCGRPEQWPWSSYKAIAGFERPPPFLTVALVRSLFGRGERALARYREFVEEGAMAARAMSRDLVRGHGVRGHGRMRQASA